MPGGFLSLTHPLVDLDLPAGAVVFLVARMGPIAFARESAAPVGTLTSDHPRVDF